MSKYSVSVTQEAVAPSAVETILQIVASAEKAISLVRMGISFGGTSPTDDPVRVELLRQNSAGTSSVYTPAKLDPRTEEALASALTAFTAEPVAGDVLESHQITPYGGLLVMHYAPDERIVVPAAGRLGVRVLAAASVTVSVFAVFEE